MATKMSYAAQLKHPSWQKKRLEILDGVGWRCTLCGDKETTLHVHHKQYLKGRMAWEYSRHELAVVCETCHEIAHRQKEAIENEMAALDLPAMPLIHALLVGHRWGLVESEGTPKADADSEITEGNSTSNYYWIGRLTDRIGQSISSTDARAIYKAAELLGPSEFVRVLQESIAKDGGERSPT